MVQDDKGLTRGRRARAVFSTRYPHSSGAAHANIARRGKLVPDALAQTGGGGSAGPPDLDEMWRDFNRRISRLFKRRVPGGPDGGRGVYIGLGIVIGVLLAVYLGSGIFVVPQGHVGVVTQFGLYKYTALPGIRWRLPYPFESDEVVNTAQVRSVEIGRGNVLRASDVTDAALLTRDGDIVEVRFAVQYRIQEPTEFLFEDTDPEGAVVQAARAAVRDAVARRELSGILDEGRDRMAGQLMRSIQGTLDSYKTGILVIGVTMQSVAPPEQVKNTFDEVIQARHESEQAASAAQVHAAGVLPRAHAAAQRLVDEAQVYKAEVVARAQGDAQRFLQVLAAYQKAPAVTRERMYLDTMQQIYGRTAKVWVDGKGGANVLYLPLDKMIDLSRQTANANTARAAAGAHAPAVAPGGANGADDTAVPSDADGGACGVNDNGNGDDTHGSNTNHSADGTDGVNAGALAAASTPASPGTATQNDDPARARDWLRSRARAAGVN